MSENIKLGRKYRYRNGEPARVICLDFPRDDNGYKVLSCTDIGCKGVNVGALNWHDDQGFIFNPKDWSDWDLIEVKEKKVFWINVYNEEAYAYRSRIHADSNANKSVRKALVKVEYEEGQFDE